MNLASGVDVKYTSGDCEIQRCRDESPVWDVTSCIYQYPNEAWRESGISQ